MPHQSVGGGPAHRLCDSTEGFLAQLPHSVKQNRIFNAGMIPNIKENPRNRTHPKRGRKRLFNAAIHASRMRVERTFAWEDKFKRLLLCFERIQQRHYGMKLLAYTLINLRSLKLSQRC